MDQHYKKFANFLERNMDVLTNKEVVIVTWHVLRLQYHDYKHLKHRHKMFRANNKLADYEEMMDFRREVNKL